MENRHKQNIVLIGFMGSGKTTISNTLKEKYRMEVIDMDSEIELREGRKISEIFASDGEEYFRNLETELLRELQKKENLVISCGGGTPLREQNVAEMRRNGDVFLLSAAPATIYERVKDSHDRPILEGNKSVSFIEELLEKRRGKYEEAADFVIETDGKTAEEICEEIIQIRKD